MASPIDTRNESLQCVACAIRQDENSNITETDLLQFMNWCRNPPSGADRTKFNRIKDHVDIDDQFYEIITKPDDFQNANTALENQNIEYFSPDVFF